MLSKRVTQYLAMLTLALMHLNHQRLPSYLVGSRILSTKCCHL